MANFDEDIKRITEDVLSDGTVDAIIREKIVKGFESAIEDAFRWGEIKKAIEERVKTVLVPFIETYSMDDYLVKIDTVLSEIVNKSALVDNKKLLTSFEFMMTEPIEKEIKVSELFKEYKKFVEINMDTYGRHASFDTGEPEYDPMDVSFTFEEEDGRSWSSFKYATIDFTVEEEDQQDELNRTIRLSRYKNDKEDGWEIRMDTNTDIYSLRHMKKFDLFMAKLQRANVRVVIDDEEDDDSVYPDEKPEFTLE